MTKLQQQTRSLLISAALAVGSLGFIAGASAGVMYDGYADFELKLVDVSGGGDGNNNGNGSGGWSVSSTSGVFDSGLASSGSGSAVLVTSLNPANDWAIGDSSFQTSGSSGEAGGVTGNVGGTASSFADTFFSVTLENRSGSGSGPGGQSRDFDFFFYSYVDAFLDDLGAPGGDGGAYAEIVLFDSLGEELFFSSAEAFVGGPGMISVALDDLLTFTVAADSSYTFSGIVYTDGYATVAVPIGPTFWLMGAGLLGLLGTQRRNINTTV